MAREVALSAENDLLATYFFYQAIEDVNSGQVKAGNKLYELKALQNVAKKVEVRFREEVFVYFTITVFT